MQVADAARGVRRHASDLRGATRLITEATVELTALVEAMHARIASLPGTSAGNHTRGLTGLVYRSVKGVMHAVGSGADHVLARLEHLLLLATESTETANPDEPHTASRQRQALLSALNGVIGDHLAATSNPLALPMVLRHQGQALDLNPTALQRALPHAGPRVLVLLHGLCMNDLQWQNDIGEGTHDHGAALAMAGGYTPVYLRYNTGLPIHANGAQFACLMEQLLQAWPQPVERVVLLAHSMGGLVARSALHQGMAAGAAWASRVNDTVFLGTPHHGAPLERIGHGIDLVLAAAPYAAPLARIGRMRSAGITDLRHGRITPEGHSPTPQPVPLPGHVRCHTIAADRAANAREPASLRGRLNARFIGDGLVPVDSALGRHRHPERHLAFVPERQRVLHGMNHMELLTRPEVMRVLTEWLC